MTTNSHMEMSFSYTYTQAHHRHTHTHLYETYYLILSGALQMRKTKFELRYSNSKFKIYCIIALYVCVSRSLMSDSLQPHGP